MSLATLDDIHQFNISTWAEVDLNAIRHNYNQIKRLAGKYNAVLCVVKGDAYGHGMIKVAALLDQLGLGFFAVSDIEEGILLRKNGIKQPILLFESTLPEQARWIVDYNLTPTICTWELARHLNNYAKSQGQRLDIHMEIDTGMGRLGVDYKEAFEFIQRVNRLQHLSIKGLFTHFPVAEMDRVFTKKQIVLLHDLVVRLDKAGLVVPYIHAANSMGVIGYQTRILNLIRPGLMLYGLPPVSGPLKNVRLKPALSVKSKVVFIKNIAKGQGISYGHTFVAKRPMRIATLAIGYKDGYLRGLSNKAFVLLGGKRCQVLGKVTMDQIMVDVTRVPAVRVGSPAVILGRQGKATITADELAVHANTISYEIICSLGNNLPRVYR